jgi:hypothetical protein
VRRKWTELPVPNEVISRLDELSTNPEDDLEKFLNEQEDPNEELEGERIDVVPESEDFNIESNITTVDDEDNNIGEERVDDEEETKEMNTFNEENSGEEIMLQDIEPQVEEELHQYDPEGSVTQQHRYNLRPNRTLSYMHKFAFLSVHAGVKEWGVRAKEAIKDELKMLNKEGVFFEIKQPTDMQKCKALMIHCFVIEKREGRIKARAVADGRSQQRYMEEETCSPTVKLESIMLNAFIDAFEGRHVVTVDIKGAFLKAKVPEEMELMVKMTGELAQIMCKINPEMRCDEQGIIYLRCVKALYGHIKAAWLFYDDLSNTIQHKLGFKQNHHVCSIGRIQQKMLRGSHKSPCR